jgi:cytidylate kinase
VRRVARDDVAIAVHEDRSARTVAPQRFFHHRAAALRPGIRVARIRRQVGQRRRYGAAFGRGVTQFRTVDLVVNQAHRNPPKTLGKSQAQNRLTHRFQAMNTSVFCIHRIANPLR